MEQVATALTRRSPHGVVGMLLEAAALVADLPWVVLDWLVALAARGDRP